MLNKRLSACAEYVSRGGIAADIGTDHAYLPVYLIKEGISRSVYACDIADGPLASARKSVESEGLSRKITLIKSNGLDGVPQNGITDVIIAGMGGELIEDIVKRADWLKAKVNLVLQPNTKAVELISFLWLGGYEIINDRAVRDGKYIYRIVNARYCGKVKNADALMCMLGALDLSDEVSREYILFNAERLFTAADGMSGSGDESLLKESKRLIRLAQSLTEAVKSAKKDVGKEPI